MHYMLVTSITLPLQAASNGRNYMHYMANYMLSKMLMRRRRPGRGGKTISKVGSAYTLASSKACNGPCNACNYVHYMLLVMAT